MAKKPAILRASRYHLLTLVQRPILELPTVLANYRLYRLLFFDVSPSKDSTQGNQRRQRLLFNLAEKGTANEKPWDEVALFWYSAEQ